MSTESTPFTADEIAIRAGKAASDPVRREMLALIRATIMIDATEITRRLNRPRGHTLFHLRALLTLGAVECDRPLAVGEANAAQVLYRLDRRGVADAALALVDQLADSTSADPSRLDALEGIIRWVRPHRPIGGRSRRRPAATRRRRALRRSSRARWVRITVAQEGSAGELAFVRDRTDRRRWSASLDEHCAGPLTQLELVRVLALFLTADE